MNPTLVNKPRVFLSHSKKDISFIRKLCNDLRHCHIEPWIDSEDIHHGQPWLDAIFEIGIPTCDAVLVYLTESSIESPMVKKEIDASLIEKLQNQNIGFLPYVSDEMLRDRLRADIRSLQIPVFNKKNYKKALPRVVSEIWQSHLIRILPSAINEEKVRRLEAELELEKIKKKVIDGIFDAHEVADFEYIWKQLDRHEILELLCYIRNEDKSISEKSQYSFSVHLQTILPQLDLIDNWDFPYDDFSSFLKYRLIASLPITERRKNIELKWSHIFGFLNELGTYGLIKKQQRREKVKELSPYTITIKYVVFTDKFSRFKYWLDHKNILPNNIKYIEYK
jgi:hypothetical protein